MNKNLLIIFVSLFAVTSVSCSTIRELKEKEYGVLVSAVLSSAEKTTGKYSGNLPDDFDRNALMNLVKDKIPREYYKELERHYIDVEPKGDYYLLKAYDSPGTNMILFDYSCTPKLDGNVWEEPGKYDLNRLELYDECKLNN